MGLCYLPIYSVKPVQSILLTLVKIIIIIIKHNNLISFMHKFSVHKW